MATDRPWRGQILLEEGEVLEHAAWEGEQHVLRLHAPGIARRAEPGAFCHVRCAETLPMRRPISIQRADPVAGWLEILYKVVGHGTRLLAGQPVGARLSLLGPIGNGFALHGERPRPLLIGGGVGVPPMVFLAQRIAGERQGYRPLVLMGSEVPFPFPVRPSTILVPGMPHGVIAAMRLLDDWGIPSRLASLQGYPGCHDGYVTGLAAAWLEALGTEARNEVEVYACGPRSMLAAVAALAAEHGLPCQVSLEEYMACAVGGCAGCVVEVQTDAGPAMQRVCVDGPVFEARRVCL